ncbi:MAG TPA: M23 family metallopeptidase [Gaiellaceae bacterium]|jgi:hypothetical protein
MASQTRAPVGISTPNLLLATGALIVFAVVEPIGYLIGAIPFSLIGVPIAIVAARAWHAGRGRLEYGLLRHPLSGEVRPHLVQALNQLLFFGLFAAALIPGTLGTLEIFVSHETAHALRVGSWIGLVVLAACALVPRRRIYVPTNILLAAGSIFLAIQLVKIYLPPVNPVTVDLPFAGEWYVFSGGRSVLINDHIPVLAQRNAIDLLQFADGRPYQGDEKKLASYPAWGKTLTAPADGRVVAAVDSFPDLTPGTEDRDHPAGNYVIVDIGGGRYVLMAHLRQGSVRVAVGETVRRGQAIAQVGNSGETGEPHLHIQVQNKPSFDIDLAGLHTYPILFRDAVLVRGGEERPPTDVDVRRDDRVRRSGG